MITVERGETGLIVVKRTNDYWTYTEVMTMRPNEIEELIEKLKEIKNAYEM